MKRLLLFAVLLAPAVQRVDAAPTPQPGFNPPAPNWQPKSVEPVKRDEAALRPKIDEATLRRTLASDEAALGKDDSLILKDLSTPDSEAKEKLAKILGPIRPAAGPTTR